MSFIGLWCHLDGLPQRVYLLGALIMWGLEVRITLGKHGVKMGMNC